MNWIDLDQDFGMPQVTLQLFMREPLGYRYRDGLTLVKKDDALALVSYTTLFLEAVRTELKGLVLLQLCADPLKSAWTFTIIHQSLPRLPRTETNRQRLAKCVCCLKPLPLDQPTWLRQLSNDETVEMCDAACNSRFSELQYRSLREQGSFCQTMPDGRPRHLIDLREIDGMKEVDEVRTVEVNPSEGWQGIPIVHEQPTQAVALTKPTGSLPVAKDLDTLPRCFCCDERFFPDGVPVVNPLSGKMVRTCSFRCAENIRAASKTEEAKTTWGCWACKKRFETENINAHRVQHPHGKGGSVFACSDTCKAAVEAEGCSFKAKKPLLQDEPMVEPGNVSGILPLGTSPERLTTKHECPNCGKPAFLRCYINRVETWCCSRECFEKVAADAPKPHPCSHCRKPIEEGHFLEVIDGKDVFTCSTACRAAKGTDLPEVRSDNRPSDQPRTWRDREPLL